MIDVASYVQAFLHWITSEYLPQLPLKAVDYLVFVLILGYFGNIQFRRSRLEQSKKLGEIHLAFLAGIKQVLKSARTSDEKYREAVRALTTAHDRISAQQLELVRFVPNDDAATKLGAYVETAKAIYDAVTINIRAKMTTEDGQLLFPQMRRLVEGDKLGGLYVAGKNPVFELCTMMRSILSACGHWIIFGGDRLSGAEKGREIDNEARTLKGDIEVACKWSFSPTTAFTSPQAERRPAVELAS